MTDTNNHISTKIDFEIEGKTYTFSQLTIGDLRRIEQHLKDFCIESVKGQLVGLTIELQRDLLQSAREEAKAIQLGNAAFNSALQSTEGICYILWLSTSKNKEIERKAFENLLTPEVLGKLVAKLDTIMGMPKKEASEESPLEPAAK